MPSNITKARSIIRALLIFLFVYAGFSKMLDLHLFRMQLGESPLVGPFAAPLACILPVVELLIAFALCHRRTEMYGLYASVFLLSLFTGYIYYLLNEAYYIPCSCGGLMSILSWKQHLFLNVGFLWLSITAILTSSFAHTELANKKNPGPGLFKYL